MSTFVCSRCGEEKPIQSLGGTGYSVDNNGQRICYACCAILDREELLREGKQVGYLDFPIAAIHDWNGKHKPMGWIERSSPGEGFYMNWCGTFKIPVPRVKRSINNFGAERLDFWFIFEGSKYWGYSVGDNQIAHVRRVKG